MSLNHDSLLRAVRDSADGSRRARQQYVLDPLSELHERTTRAEVKGNTLWALGTTLRLGEGELSEEDDRSLIAMFEQLVQTYLEAPPASDAAARPGLAAGAVADLRDLDGLLGRAVRDDGGLVAAPARACAHGAAPCSP